MNGFYLVMAVTDRDKSEQAVQLFQEMCLQWMWRWGKAQHRRKCWITCI